MKRLFTHILYGAIFLQFILLSGCGGVDTQQKFSNTDISPLPCVVVLPVEVQRDGSIGDETNDNLQAGAEFLNRTLLSELGKSKVSRIVESTEFQQHITEVSGGKIGTIREIGKRVQCDSVLMTTLNKFRQRQGGNLAVDSPAAAAFEMQLIQASTGSGLWGTTFRETQSSLLSNLFSFGKAKSRGFKWITVEELTHQGVSEKLAECPYFN